LIFYSLKKNNDFLRYVALNTLQHAVTQNIDAGQAIQRHRSTIIECVKVCCLLFFLLLLFVVVGRAFMSKNPLPKNIIVFL
jgi:hypothetical protein